MHIYLSIVVLILTIVAAIATVGYNATINSQLSFKQKQDNTDYINTQRSYRPPTPSIPKAGTSQAPKN